MSRAYVRTFEWRFDRPPEAVWPALSDTARFNEAAGLEKQAIKEVPQPDGSVRFFARSRKGPFPLAWEEIPVEWVDGQWFRHLRVFSQGPLKSLCATLRLAPSGDGGAIGHYTVEATPANLLGTAVLRTGFFPSIEKVFGRLAVEAGDWAAGRRETPFTVPPAKLDDAARARIEASLDRIEQSPHGHGLARRLVDWILNAQEVDLVRIRPLVLARLWGVDERHVIELCLQAVKDGLLDLRWDLLCPRCRGAKGEVSALDAVPAGAHCATCNIDYERDFARNVEITFRPVPTLRTLAAGEFCLFGPMTTPHVKAQVALAPGESKTLPATLAPGPYRLRTLEVGGETDIVHDGDAFPELVCAADGVTAGAPADAGAIRLTNRGDRPRIAIVESRAWVAEALTAHRVTTLQAFRDLFSDEVLRPGDDVGIAQVTLMFTDLKGSTAFYQQVGDANAYGVIREHFAYLAQAVRAHNGAVVKTIGDAVMAAFADPADAVRAALAMQNGVEAFNATMHGGATIVIKLGLHAGPCIAVTMNGRLDYFGSVVNMAARLQGESAGGDIVLSHSLAGDPLVAALIAPYAAEEDRRDVRGFADPVDFIRVYPDQKRGAAPRTRSALADAGAR